MHKSLIITVALLLSLLNRAPAQEKLNTMDVDRQSYALYEQQQWKALITLARSAIKQDIDFYYLQYRLGIAYYELKKYRQAIPCFEKVIQQNPDDRMALEYLYYSYLFSGRQEDARVLSNTFDEAMLEQLSLNNDPVLIHALGVEYKLYQFDDFTAPDMTPANDLDQKVRKKLNYSNINLTHLTRKSFSLFHAFSYLWGLNRVYDPLMEAYEFDENLRQFQYYLAGNVHAGRGFDITFGGHYLRTTLEGLNPDISPGPGPGPGNQNYKYLYISSENSFAGFLRLSKSVSNFNFRISAAISDLNGGVQYLPLAGVDYYPLGNTKLFLSAETAYLFAAQEERYDPGLILKGKAGIRLFKPLWIEPFAQYGKVSNYADEDAFVIYNSHDVIDYWYGARVNIFLAGFKVNLYYIFQAYQNTNYYNLTGVRGEIGYGSATHLLGLKWKLQ